MSVVFGRLIVIANDSLTDVTPTVVPIVYSTLWLDSFYVFRKELLSHVIPQCFGSWKWWWAANLDCHAAYVVELSVVQSSWYQGSFGVLECDQRTLVIN